ncbi:DNA-binding transcriptional LysR family regulator [Ewingella americana]
MSVDGRLLSGMSILATVVEAGNFSRAGEVLGLSTSGVSRAITRLEDRMGIRLLDRTTRTLRLTSEGASLYERAVPHLQSIEEAANYISGAAVAVRGALRVSLNPIFAKYLLAPKMTLLQERFPGLVLTVIQQPDMGDLVADGIDVAVRFGPQPPSTMTSRLLLKDRVLTVASPAYLAKHGKPQHPEELIQHNCIQYIDPRSGKPFTWEFHRGREILPVETKGQLITSDVDTMLQACLNGAGIAQPLGISVEQWLKRGELVELFPDWPDEVYPLYIARPSRRLAPAAVEAFIHFCLEICAEHQAG